MDQRTLCGCRRSGIRRFGQARVSARLVGLDESARSGPEFSDPSRGGYDLDRVGLRGDDLASIDLKPSALKEFIPANREALLAEAGAAA